MTNLQYDSLSFRLLCLNPHATFAYYQSDGTMVVRQSINPDVGGLLFTKLVYNKNEYPDTSTFIMINKHPDEQRKETFSIMNLQEIYES